MRIHCVLMACDSRYIPTQKSPHGRQHHSTSRQSMTSETSSGRATPLATTPTLHEDAELFMSRNGGKEHLTVGPDSLRMSDTEPEIRLPTFFTNHLVRYVRVCVCDKCSDEGYAN